MMIPAKLSCALQSGEQTAQIADTVYMKPNTALKPARNLKYFKSILQHFRLVLILHSTKVVKIMKFMIDKVADSF